jgi:heparin binding hemagglutinin HbhA
VITMPVTLPTAADVRKVREQAAKNAAERAEAARTPLLAVLGAGDAAVTVVTKAIVDAQTRRRAQADKVQAYVTTLPKRLNADEARKAVAELREQAGTTYAGLAERGEKAWGKIRTQPQVKDAIARIETYTEKLDARVDSFVDDAHDAAEKALAAVTRQTRSVGEKAARDTEKAADEAAETVGEVAGKISEAGAEAAHATRSTTRRVANRTAPKAATPKPATRRSNGAAGS